MQQEQLFSRRQWLCILKWTLYSILFLFSMLLQSSVLPKMPVGGIYLCSVPGCIACIAVYEKQESSTLFAIFAGVFYALSGAKYGPLYVAALAFSAALTGSIVSRCFTRGFLSCAILSLMTLAICQGLAFFFRVYIGTVSAVYWQTVLIPEIFFSLLVVPFHFVCVRAISKIGG